MREAKEPEFPSRAEVILWGQDGSGQAGGDLSDARLVMAVAGGYVNALAVAYARYGASVNGMAGQLCGPRQAGEVTQAVFLSLWCSPGNFRLSATGSLRALLLAETHRRAVDLLRADTARIAWEARMPPEILELVILARTANGAVRQLLAGLSRTERQAVTLTYFGGYTRQQAAALLRLPEQAVNASLRTAMARLHASTDGLMARAELAFSGPVITRDRPERRARDQAPA